VSLDQLAVLGICHWQVNSDNIEENEKLEEIRRQRNYKNFDIVTISREKLPNYDQKVVDFYQEHLHEDEEIRFVLEGSGYFDVRVHSPKDHWIRIEVEKNDMIVLPAGIYHRFTVDMNNSIKVMRLFQGLAKWQAYNRGLEVDQMPIRQAYSNLLAKLQNVTHNTNINTTSSESDKKCPDHQSSGKNGTSYIMDVGARALAAYPHMRKANGMLYISGISSRRPDNSHVGATLNQDGSWTLDIKSQTAAVISNIQNILQSAGADLSYLVDLTCYLTDMKHYNDFNTVYNQFFNAQSGPTRTTIAVYQLPHPNLLIEIKAVAVAP